MMETKKQYFFADFTKEFAHKSIQQNKLKIDEIYNLTTNNGVIENLPSLDDFSKTLFSTTADYQSFQANNTNLITKIKHYEIYEYFDTTSSSYKNRIFAIDDTFKLYELNTSTFTLVQTQYTFSAMPIFYNFNGKLYIHQTGSLFLVIENELAMVSLTSHSDIEFFMYYNSDTFYTLKNDKTTIYYAEETEIEDLDLSGENYDSVKLANENGEIIKLLILKNNLYVIQNYAISKVVFGSEIKITNNVEIGSKIINNSCTNYLDYIFFATSENLFLFDGNDLKIIFKNELLNFDFSNSKSICFNNKIFLTVAKISGNENQYYLIQLDYINDKFLIFKLENFSDLFILKNANNYILYLEYANSNAFYSKILSKNISNNYKKLILFSPIYFENYEEKIISKISFSSKYSFNLKIKNEQGYEKNYSINSDTKIINVGLKGRFFIFEISTEIPSVYIDSFFVEVAKLED